MTKILNLDFGQTIQIAISDKITDQLMVCSHERSGTHFMMNTMQTATVYTAQPWLNYDLAPLGASINFFEPNSAQAFIKKTSNLIIEKKKYCNSSIIKSHFPLSLLGSNLETLPLKIIYIFRDPYETLLSYWKFLHKLHWNEGPKTSNPLELVQQAPSGQSQRYQTKNQANYFDRWAAHVEDGIRASLENSNITMVEYKQLLSSHKKTVEQICSQLSINIISKPAMPSKYKNTIQGAPLEIAELEKENLKNYCRQQLKNYPLIAEYTQLHND